MNAITKTTVVAALVTLGLALTAWTAEPPKPETPTELDKLVGQPADLSPWAYAWRADREVQEKPEAYFIPRRLDRLDRIYRPIKSLPKDAGWRGTQLGATPVLQDRIPAPKGVLHAALLWETRVPWTKIGLRWSKDGRPVPPAEAVEVRIYAGHHGWWGLQADWALVAPDLSSDRLIWSYRPAVAADGPKDGRDSLVWSTGKDKPIYDESNPKMVLRTDMISVFVNPKTAPDGGAWAVPTIHAFGPLVGKRMDVEIEWGFQPGDEQKDFSGRIEGYFGQVGKVVVLQGDSTSTLAGDAAWQSTGKGGQRRGIVLPVLYFPGYGRASTLSSKITIWSKAGNFTFLPEDVNQGPVLVPEHGVCVLKAGSGKTAGQWAADLAAKNVKSVRQIVREHPEPSWEGVMQAKIMSHQPAGATLPPYRQVAPSSVSVEVPEQRWTDAWRNYSLLTAKGPFSWWGLGGEGFRPTRAMDLTGSHADAAHWLETIWLSKPGDKGDGDYLDGDGSFENVKSMTDDIDYKFDGSHPGTGGLLNTMVDHYFLTGDRQWFQKHGARMQKAADWIIRQRSHYLKEAPNRSDLWADGLLPPHVWADIGWGKSQRRWHYITDGWACQGLQRFAEMINEFDPVAGKKYLEEADLYRRQIRKAVERSMTLSPVRPVRNGTYRTHIPALCYTRGLMNDADQCPNYTLLDIVSGPSALMVSTGVPDPHDRRVDAYLDVLEDTLVSDPGPNTYWSCDVEQLGYNNIAQLYLLRDDIPEFLRTWMVNFAGYVAPGGGTYYFGEHTHRGKIRLNAAAKAADDKAGNNSNSSAFVMTCFRNLLMMEIGDSLWLARATPRVWLEQGKKISVKNAPTYFGTVAYEIVSDVDNGKISATVELPVRKAPKEVVLRFRHPKSAPMKGVTVNGKPWTSYDKDKEIIILKGLTGTVTVTAQY
jgi:hypothetical protein